MWGFQNGSGTSLLPVLTIFEKTVERGYYPTFLIVT